MRRLFKALRANALDLFVDGVGVMGAAAITFGAWQVYVPAGWVVGGSFALICAWLLGRSPQPPQEPG